MKAERDNVALAGCGACPSSVAGGIKTGAEVVSRLPAESFSHGSSLTWVVPFLHATRDPERDGPKGGAGASERRQRESERHDLAWPAWGRFRRKSWLA